MPTLVLQPVMSILSLCDEGAPRSMIDNLRRIGATTIPLRFETGGDRNILASSIDRMVAEAGRPVLFVAHGLGCVATAWWARLSPSHYLAKVAGAIMIDPMPAYGEARLASPPLRLSFPSTVVVRRASTEAAEIAAAYGSTLSLETSGKPAARFPIADLLRDFSRRIVDHQEFTARRFMGD